MLIQGLWNIFSSRTHIYIMTLLNFYAVDIKGFIKLMIFKTDLENNGVHQT